jgi:energy-coupling factor transporter ATP-binding protein EcfA2
MPKRKKHSAQHTLVTGHSGAGKSTLARSFGLPVHALDDDPDIREQLNRQMAYARANQGRLPLGKQYAKDMRRAEERAIGRAMALKDPHVIEGSYLLNRDPKDFKAHNLHLVDTPEDVVLDRRVERQRVKDLARNRHWDDARAQGVRMRGQQLIDEYAPGVKRWRSADYVKKASRQSQEEIFNLLKRRIPSGAHHVSGGLPDARGLSDVDIYLPRKRFTGLEQQFPKGTTVTKQGDDYAIYSIPGFKREVNVYATNNPAKRESIDHRRTMMALASKYPQAERRAFAIKQKGKGSEPAWAEVLGLQGDPYEVMRDTDKVMQHASTMKLASKLQSLSAMRRAAKENKTMSRRDFLKHLLREAAEVATTDKSDYMKGLAKDVVGLPKLAHDVKTAARKLPRFPMPPEFGNVTNRYYQARQGDIINYGNAQYANYRNPRRKRARSMEDTYRTKTAEKTKRRMSHVDPDKYNDNFRLGQMIGTGAAGMSLGAAIGGLGKRGTNKRALGGALIGAGTGALLGRGLYRRKSDAVVYDATKRTPRHRVRRSLLADIKNVDPTLLSAPDNHFMTEEELRKTASKGVATKSDPAAWNRAKAQARAKMGGKHSARAMQLATQIYKKNGGGYSGTKPSSGTNKLKKWTKQDWQWSGRDTPGPGGTGVYLPKRATGQLRSTDAGREKLRAAAAAKRAATNAGEQFSRHGLHVGKRRGDLRG